MRESVKLKGRKLEELQKLKIEPIVADIGYFSVVNSLAKEKDQIHWHY